MKISAYALDEHTFIFQYITAFVNAQFIANLEFLMPLK